MFSPNGSLLTWATVRAALPFLSLASAARSKNICAALIVCFCPPSISMVRCAHGPWRSWAAFGVAFGVRRAFPGRELLELHIERARRYLDLTARHRLAEEVIGLQIGVQRLLRQVIALVRLQLVLELGQHVFPDADGLVRLLLVE